MEILDDIHIHQKKYAKGLFSEISLHPHTGLRGEDFVKSYTSVPLQKLVDRIVAETHAGKLSHFSRYENENVLIALAGNQNTRAMSLHLI